MTEGPTTSKLQAFVMERMHRTAIRGAPYNPRVISSHERAKLANLIKKVGLLGPVTVNRTTGMTLVGGHQRIAVLDAYEGGTDYLVDVAVVELTEKQEREANAGLNNSSAQGSYDAAKLEAMFSRDAEIKLDYEVSGFTDTDMQQLFGPSFFATYDAVAAATSTAAAPIVAEVLGMVPPKNTDAHDEAVERRKAQKEDKKAENARGTYVVAYFDRVEDGNALRAALGYDADVRDIDGMKLLALVRTDATHYQA
jgi:hypothetical protein